MMLYHLHGEALNSLQNGLAEQISKPWSSWAGSDIQLGRELIPFGEGKNHLCHPMGFRLGCFDPPLTAVRNGIHKESPARSGRSDSQATSFVSAIGPVYRPKLDLVSSPEARSRCLVVSCCEVSSIRLRKFRRRAIRRVHPWLHQPVESHRSPRP